MTNIELAKTISSPEYDFLRHNEHLGDKIMFLTLGGSHAYGTNVEGSDIDIRGIALNSRQDLLGLSNFEQVVDNQTDTTVYAFRKFVGLICACNPNTIEMLGGRPEHYANVTESGKILLENRSLFLSKRAIHSFGGYANAQLRRLQAGCSKDEINEHQKAEYILESCRHAMSQLEEKHGMPRGFVTLSIASSPAQNGRPVILMYPGDGWKAFDEVGVPFESANSFMSELNSIIKSYETFGRRNQRAKDKSTKQLNKHAMHLVRLYLMAFDILEKGEINTYREADRDFLLGIRGGSFMLEDGSFRPEFFEIINEYEKRLEYDAKETTLPKNPDYKKIEELVMAVNENAIKEGEYV